MRETRDTAVHHAAGSLADTDPVALMGEVERAPGEQVAAPRQPPRHAGIRPGALDGAEACPSPGAALAPRFRLFR